MENKENERVLKLLNKVPEITLWFWFIKIMCTTVGETAADYLNVNLNLGLTGTSIVTGLLLAVALFFQFRAKKYIPATYWLSVMLVSVFGTLVTDNLTDKLGVPLETSTIIFSILLASTFLIWYYFEKTLSIHSIFTSRREIFYWLAILFTFALGTAAGDLMAEGLGLGYATTGFIIAGLIALFAIGWKLKLNHVLSFWMIYILTRPLGASIGDYLSQPTKYGGLGLGATITSFIFVGGILVIVTYLSLTKKDVIDKEPKVEIEEKIAEDQSKGALWQTGVVVAFLVIAGMTGYHFRQAALQADTAVADNVAIQASNQVATSSKSPSAVNDKTTTKPIKTTSLLGDLSSFKAITQDTLNLVNSGDLSGAKTRVADLEHEWDNGEARLKPKSQSDWTKVDDAIDKALRSLRAVNPSAAECKGLLTALLAVLN
ncbi:MAG: hypothetical protein WCG01_04880 [bacterium]